MNLKRILLAFLGAGALLCACKEEEDFGTPKIVVTPSELNLSSGDVSETVELLATRDWYLTGQPDWAAVSVEVGEASTKPQSVTVSVSANPGYDRTGEIIFNIGLAKAALVIRQKGDKGELSMGSGTLEDPYTVAGVIDFVNGLGKDVNSEDKVFIKGKVCRLGDQTYTTSGTYGNATFWMSDNGEVNTVDFYCYRILYLGNKKYTSGDDVKVGDEVIVCGQVVNYRGNTPETVQNGAFLYSLNGKTDGGYTPSTEGEAKGSGTQADPYNVAAALKAVKNLTWTANDNYQKVGPYYVSGKVSRVKEGESFTTSGNFGNATFWISDDGGTENEFQCYRVLYLGNKKYTSGDDVKPGDSVVICAELMNYRGNTPETVQGTGYLYSLNGKTDGGEPSQPQEPSDPGTPSGEGTLQSPYNAAAANQVASALADGEKTDSVFVAGKVSSIKYTFSAQYGTATFNISDDGGTSGSQFTCYSVYYLQSTPWKDGHTQIKVGDSVIIRGLLCNYQGNTPETSSKEAYIYSLNGNTVPEEVGGGGGGGEQPSGDFASNVTWTDGSNGAYTQKANVNGSETTILKLGTGSAIGSSTITCPAASTKLSFYAISWKDKPSELIFKVGGKQVASISPAANSGLAGNPTYTISVKDSDHYTVDLGSAVTEVTVETSGSNPRAALFAIIAE